MSFSSLLPLIISGTGLFLLIRLKFFFFIHPIKVVRAFVAELRSKESQKSLCLALAGTLGVGNIFGTAAGIMVGGAGSVFWLLVSALFSCVLKYSETALTLELKAENERGLQTVLPKIFRKRGRALGFIYSCLCLALSLLMGSAIQSTAVADISASAIDIPKGVSALILCLLVLLGISGGTKRIEKATSVLVPLASAVFIVLSVFCIVINRSNIPDVLGCIFSEAISVEAATGGAFGFVCSRVMSEGFARGILSNEAGIGTSAMAHSRADKRTPFVGGLFGIAEVLFDTVILCGLTALTLLTSPIGQLAFMTPMAYVNAAYESTLGGISGPLLTVSVLVFAYSTMICWYYYGTECIKQIYGKKSRNYPTLFFVCAVAGALVGSGYLLNITDTIIFLMALITLSALIASHNKIASITKI